MHCTRLIFMAKMYINAAILKSNLSKLYDNSLYDNGSPLYLVFLDFAKSLLDGN